MLELCLKCTRYAKVIELFIFRNYDPFQIEDGEVFLKYFLIDLKVSPGHEMDEF